MQALQGEGVCLASLQRPAEAALVLEACLQRMREELGRDDPFTLRCVFDLGTVLSMQGMAERRAEAVRLLLESYEGRRVVLGPEHEDTLRSMHDASVLRMELLVTGEAKEEEEEEEGDEEEG